MAKPEDAFGFGSLSAAREKLRSIRPSAPVETPADLERVDLDRVDRVAADAGFVSREAQAPEYPVFTPRRVQRPEPRIPLNMRMPVSLGVAFQRFCEENRYSYPEGLAEIMRRAGLPTR